MKITAQEVLEIMNLMQEAEQYKPLVKQGIQILKSYAKELDEPLKELQNYLRQSRVDSVKFYLNNDFTKEEAILMSMHDSVALKKIMDNYKTNKTE